MEKPTFKEISREVGIMVYAGFTFGAALGGGCYLGWAFVRGLVRLLGA